MRTAFSRARSSLACGWMLQPCCAVTWPAFYRCFNKELLHQNTALSWIASPRRPVNLEEANCLRYRATACARPGVISCFGMPQSRVLRSLTVARDAIKICWTDADL